MEMDGVCLVIARRSEDTALEEQGTRRHGRASRRRFEGQAEI